jgi:hypothetical protein
MLVTAFSTTGSPDWRWRITNNACEILEESHTTFPTIGTAIAEGTKRLLALNVTDHSIPPPRFPRSTSHRRSR